MAARFTSGNSHRNPPGVKNTQGGGKNHTAEPRTKSFALQRGNTMAGMPGFIGTKAKADRGHDAQGGKGMGPHREGYIGERGASKIKYGEGGTMCDSPGYLKGAGEGRIEQNDRTGRRGPRTRSGRAMPAQQMTPQSEGHSRGFNAHEGKDARPLPRGRTIEEGMGREGGGHRGRMERLKGHTRTSYEGKGRKSQMY